MMISSFHTHPSGWCEQQMAPEPPSTILHNKYYTFLKLIGRLSGEQASSLQDENYVSFASIPSTVNKGSPVAEISNYLPSIL